MDVISAQRQDAAIIAQLGGMARLPEVGGNSNARDRLQPRPAAEPGAIAPAADGDNSETRSRGEANREFTAEELAELRELRARDRQVRAHEQAHLSAAGQHAKGGASFTYETGPDGRRYAVGGEVSIDTSKVSGDPAATLAKAQQIRRAALAPADPSAQDRQVAQQAAAMAREARTDLARQQRDENQDSGARIAQAYAGAPSEPLIDLLA